MPTGTGQHAARSCGVLFSQHCPVRDTCRAIEAEFADALQAGALEWHGINVEDAGNESFVNQFGLTVPALVLVNVVDGRQTGWTKSTRVWELVQIPLPSHSM